MIAIIIATVISFTFVAFTTPMLTRFFTQRAIGQAIRSDGPSEHAYKAGTPTMGGIGIIVGATLAYVIAAGIAGRLHSAGGALVMGTFLGMGAVGFIDDYIKVVNHRNLGLSSKAKFVGQILIALLFSLGAQHVAHTSTMLSFVGRIPWLDLGAIGFTIFCFLILTATANAVNLTDGLDGLATGASAMVFAGFTMISYWILRHGRIDTTGLFVGDYSLAAWIHADTAAMAGASIMGACIGFLWHNAYPATIFMGDTGSLALGGGMAALAVLTETELLLIIMGGLFVIETLSVILQVATFKLMGGKRLFLMAPLHHHYERKGWPESQISVRFWIICVMCVAVAVGIFYTDFLIRLQAFR